MAAPKPVSYGRTPSGVELTEEVLEQAAAEAEAGYDISELRRLAVRPAMRSSTPSVLRVRLDPELRSALVERAARERTTMSAVVREALRRYLRAG